MLRLAIVLVLAILAAPLAAEAQPAGKVYRVGVLSYLAPVYASNGFAQAGGLITYVPDTAETFRRAASFVDRIFKGASPGTLPVEQPTRFELTVNLAAAKALGLTIPQSLLVRADQVVE